MLCAQNSSHQSMPPTICVSQFGLNGPAILFHFNCDSLLPYLSPITPCQCQIVTLSIVICIEISHNQLILLT